jgi:hypothetical protein
VRVAWGVEKELCYRYRVLGLARVVAVGLSSAGLTLLAAPALAVPAAELVFTRGLGAESCPDEAELKRQVSARLGEDPFRAEPTQHFVAEVVVAGNRLVGHVALLDETGKATGLREFEGGNGCAEIVSALALAVSLAINPELAVGERPPAVKPDAEAVVEPPAKPAPAAPVKETRKPAPAADAPTQGDEGVDPEPVRGLAKEVEMALGAFALASLGPGPGPTLGGALAVRGRRDSWSIALEGRLDAASTAAAGEREVTGSLAAGQIVPCGHLGFVSACAVGLLGSLSVESRGRDPPGSDAGFFAAIGGRLGAEARIARHWLAQARLDVLATLTPIRGVRNDTDRVWEAPATSAALGLGLMAELP